MAVQTAFTPSNDRAGKKDDIFVATCFTASTLNGATEHIVALPPSGASGVTAGNGWELLDVVIAAGANTTHTDGVITAAVEKNTDGGTSALTTAPAISDDAGTARRHTGAAATGITQAVVKTDGGEDFTDTDVAFVTLSETGSGGVDPTDVSVKLVFRRKADFNPDFTT